MATNAKEVTISYTPFVPTEVKPSYRKKYYDEIGLPKYVVQVDPDTKSYIRHKIRLITDPEWYQRQAYILYDATEVDMGWLQIAGYLVDKLDLIPQNRVMNSE